MTRDHGPLPRAASVSVVLSDDRLLDAAQAGERVHLSADRFKRMAARHRYLRANTIRRGGRPLWLLSTLVAYMHGLGGGESRRIGAKEVS